MVETLFWYSISSRAKDCAIGNFYSKKGSKSVFVAKESQVIGMIIDGMFITEEEAGNEHKTLYPNEILLIDRGYGKEIYRYECE